MDVREELVKLPIEDALLILREEHRQRTDSYTTYLAHGGKGDPAEEVGLDALAMAISALEKTKWISVDERLPGNFISVLGYMTDAGEFPPVRECYTVGNAFFFPALGDIHPVSHWCEMPQPPKGE